MKKKVLCMMLALTMVASLAACGKTGGTTGGTTGGSSAPEGGVSAGATGETPIPAAERAGMAYDDYSAQTYDAAFGDFYEVYQQALEAETVSERQALMAVAEAKMLESAVMLPTTTQGGLYSIGRVVPGTSTTTMWGTDMDRYHNRLITTEPIKTEHYTEMKAQWAELHGTGTYVDWVKGYLADNGYELKDTYTFGYNQDPATWDDLSTSLAVDHEACVNTYDGLMEYDCENELQPALAESYTVSDDGLTYTFKIRQGVKWVDSQAREVADLTADDWVAGLQHMMDAMGGMEYLVDGVIVGATEYINGEITDFSEVGVKAVDDYTLEYTLTAPTSYFTTMLVYGVFAPMNRSYYESQGGKFGVEFDSSAADYNYGKTADNIAYCGPYVVTNATEKNTIVFDQNPSYWNAANISNKTITWLYNDGSDPTKAYNDMKDGTIDGCNLASMALIELAKSEGLFDEYAHATETDGTSFMNFYNLGRGTWANYNDNTVCVSTQTEADAARTNAAINNVHFRRALSFGTDRITYNAQIVGDDLAEGGLRNSYTPATFVSLEEDVTIDINGTATNFAAGTFYGEIMQAQIDADGVDITVYDPQTGSGDGFDGWYNPEAAAAELAEAAAELAEAGVEISAENPIYLDVIYPGSLEQYTNRANAYKQSIENSLGGSVIVNLIDATSADNWYYAGYYPETGNEINGDIDDVSGWGPDYGDPKTYLDTILPEYAGYMTKAMGVY